MLTYLTSDEDVKQQWDADAQHNRLVSEEWDRAVPAYLSQWKFEAVSEIIRLGGLKDNWDSYGSPKPSMQVVDTAIQFIKSIPFDDLPSPNVVPVSGGGILFDWNVSARELEFEILPNCSIEFLRTERGTPFDEGGVEPVFHMQSLLAWLQA